MMEDRRGTVGLTTQKIILAVLLLLLLGLVIYGYTTGAFIPLKEKFVGAFDEVTLLIKSFGDDSDGAEGCIVSDLMTYDSDSRGLFDLFGVSENSNSTFTACRDRVCYLNIGENKFKMDNGYFYATLGSHLSPADDFVIREGMGNVSFYRDLYEASLEFLLSAQGVSTVRGGKMGADYSSGSLEIVTGKKMDKFNLMAYGDLDKKTSYRAYAEWEQGEWEVKDLEIPHAGYNGSDYNLALAEFYKIVHTDRIFDLDIRANIGSTQKNLNEIVGGWNNELDSKKELETLTQFTRDFLDGTTRKSKPSVEEVNKLKTLVDGKTLVVDGKTFLMSVEDRAGYPLIRMSSGEEVYGLSFSSNLGVWTFADSNPLGLFKPSEGKWVLIEGKHLYKVTGEKFDEIIKLNKVYDFLNERC